MITHPFTDSPEAIEADLVIVGAGIAGLYCAWRLNQANPEMKIAIIERLNRTGGRLDSDIVEITPDQFVREEQGGMRFNSTMVELMQLINKLELCDQIVDFPMGSADDTNRYNLRGHNFTLAEANASGNMIWAELYDLKPQEQGLSPTDLVTTAYHNVLQANDDLGQDSRQDQTPDFWTKFRETYLWQGKPMNQWQLWGLLRSMNYSMECVQMLSETIGFAGPFMSMANAGDAFQILADFPKDPTYYTFEFGFSTLPNAIVEQISDKVEVWLSSNVDVITCDGPRAFTLTISEAPCELNATPFVPGSTTKQVNADKLIMAVATSSAERLFHASPALHDRPEARKLWDSLHSAMGMNLMKINLYFNDPWWEQGLTNRPPVQFGPNFTNLPLNAVYPFYSLPSGTTPPESDTDEDIRGEAGAALTIYCDFSNTTFWHGLQNIGPMFASALQTTENERVPQRIYGASQAVVSEAKRQLQALFGANWIPDPILTSYRLWDGQQDFEYAYHQWKLNVVDSEVRAYLAAPFEGVYFCNEAISDMHGWVNGSLRSANAVLEHFGISPLDNDPCADPASGAETTAAPRRVRGLWS